MDSQKLQIRRARVHNLKEVSLTLPPNELVVFTGVSGSGKSSLAFDTIYVEGQRRYVESLSTFARRYLGNLAKPDAESISGVSPTISIEQKAAGKNPRSTVGTMTEIYDHIRVLFARVATPYCPESGEPVAPQSKEKIILTVQRLPEGTRLFVLAPYARGKKAAFKEDFLDLIRKGYMRVRVDGQFLDLDHNVELDGQLAHDVDVVIDRLIVQEKSHSRIAEALTEALDLGQGVCSIWQPKEEEETLFSMHAYSPKSGRSYPPLEPHDFSFNSPHGMCSSCQGMGQIKEFELDQVIAPNKSIAENCCSIASSYQTVRYGNIYDNLARLYNFSVHTPWQKLSKQAKRVFLYGINKKWVKMHFVHPDKGTQWEDYVSWKGVLHEAHHRYSEAKSEGYRKKMDKLMSQQTCPDCGGERLLPYPSAALLGNQRIGKIHSMTIAQALDFFVQLELSPSDQIIAEELLKEIQQRLQFLLDVGLDYLTLNRTSPTLSGGEAQRVRLASQIGCGLVGVTYVLDEPSIGLHPRDNRKLIQTLKSLRDKGNTVVVVEHDEETMWEADRIVDFGPGAGAKGGKILVDGTIAKLLKSQPSLTAQYLRGERKIAIPEKRRKKKKEQLTITGAEHHNLKKARATIPLGLFVAITGVSGSGKSSLISDILYPQLANQLQGGELPVGKHRSLTGTEHLDKVINIDQTPIGRTPRSNPATYIKVWDEIRDLFTQLPESRSRGYQPGRFSFNVKEGSCSHCSGMGQVKVDMDFMEDAWVDCPICHTRRYDAETLSIRFKGKNIFDVLDMEVERALTFFENIPAIHKKLSTLAQVGMGYIKLGQSSTTLSGGEAQRIKLAKELCRPSTGKTLYILDEPTTGLHFEDINHLLAILHKLVDRGNSVLVIEHNMEVVKTADWIVDIGPEGGCFGGKVVASNTPEKIAQMATPTALAVREALEHDYTAKKEEALQRLAQNQSARSQRKKLWKKEIHVEGAALHNLKHVQATVPRGKITICSGPSGSGKTSLAIDTIYAEGQRRYTESLSPYARQFVKQMPKPKVRSVEGLSPAIAIEQKAHAGNPRSTVGTQTEIYDYLRILFARIGIPHCPDTGEVIQAISKEHVVERIMSYPQGERLHILAPLELKKSDSFEELIKRYQRQGYMRLRLNGEIFDLSEEIPFQRRRKNALALVVDRLKITPASKNRLRESVEQASQLGGGKLLVMREKEDVPFNLSFSVESTGKSYPEITPKSFAFNVPEGMCPDCQGLGYQYGAALENNPKAMEMTPAELLWQLAALGTTHEAFSILMYALECEGIDLELPLKSLPPEQKKIFLNGGNQAHGLAFSSLKIKWAGLNHVLIKAAKHGNKRLRQGILPLLKEESCYACQGGRVNKLARHVTLEGQSIVDVCEMPTEQLQTFLNQLELPSQESALLEEALRQCLARVDFLCEVGLGYLSLNRTAPSLSGGEAQRIKLARQLGSSLTGVLYVLDEPTIGLHPHDNHQLNQALAKLKSLGNTLLMVEHDPLTVETADYLLDFGPQSGAQGGHITARGTLKQIKKNSDSLTGAYLSGALRLSPPKKKRPLHSKSIQISQATAHNLKNVSARIPVGNITVVTGVSGSGKSSLLNQVLVPALKQSQGKEDEVITPWGAVQGLSHFTNFHVLDQNPIGHTSRSDVGTYVDILTGMREAFSKTQEARAKGLQKKHFSYNHRAGMCTGCSGMGYKKIEMHFLPPVQISCPDCQGMRLNTRSLEIEFKGKTFGEYLQYTVDKLLDCFENFPKIARTLRLLQSVGLGYLKIGQGMATLSGGEAQRIKLSRELAKRNTGSTLYLLDEPTTGLHPDDVHKLLTVLHRLADQGNTLVLIEHHLDLMAHADYIIDLGPGPGKKGGHIVCTGTPQEVAAHPTSFTARYLKETL